MYKPELMGISPFDELEGKAAIYCDWEDRLTIMDTLLYCRFYRDLVQWPYITAVVNAAIGTDYTEDDMHRIANRIVTMSHDFNAARGIGRESERLPEWVSDKPMEDEGALTFPQAEMASNAPRLLPIRGWGSCRRSSSEPSGGCGRARDSQRGSRARPRSGTMRRSARRAAQRRQSL